MALFARARGRVPIPALYCGNEAPFEPRNLHLPR
jgi:hypothetical protein